MVFSLKSFQVISKVNWLVKFNGMIYFKPNLFKNQNHFSQNLYEALSNGQDKYPMNENDKFFKRFSIGFLL